MKRVRDLEHLDILNGMAVLNSSPESAETFVEKKVENPGLMGDSKES